MLAARLAGQVRAEPGEPGVQAARRALAEGWPLTSQRDVTDLTIVLLALCATWATDAQLAQAAAIGRDAP